MSRGHRQKRKIYPMPEKEKGSRIWREINRWMKKRKGKAHIHTHKTPRCSQAEVNVAVGGSAESTWIKNPSKAVRKKKRMKKRSGGRGGGLSASELQPMQWEMGQAGTKRCCYCHSRCLPGPRVPPNDREMARIAAASTTGTHTDPLLGSI